MQDKKLPSDKLSIIIFDNTYETVMTAGKIIDYEKNKVFYSSTLYDSISNGFALDMIDVISALYAFFPQVKDEMKIEHLRDLKLTEMKKLIDEFVDKFFPWYQEWMGVFKQAQKVEKKEENE